jgi:hypothetical protein
MDSITHEQCERARQQPGHFMRAQSVFSEDFQHIRQQSDSGAEQDKSDDIKRVRVLFPKVWQVQIDEN